MKEWGIKPWNLDKLTAKDLQDIRLAEHAEAYIEQQQREQAENQGSLSHNEYNVSESRRDAFQ